MGKNFEDFYNENNGKSIDLDKVWGAQCVDGYNWYCDWLGIKRNWAMTAVGLWNGGVHDGCTKHTSGVKKNGDIMIWGQGSEMGASGHVAMYHNGQYFGQNQGSADWTKGGPFRDWPIKQAPIGWFRPNVLSENNLTLKIRNGVIYSAERT